MSRPSLRHPLVVASVDTMSGMAKSGGRKKRGKDGNAKGWRGCWHCGVVIDRGVGAGGCWSPCLDGGRLDELPLLSCLACRHFHGNSRRNESVAAVEWQQRQARDGARRPSSIRRLVDSTAELHDSVAE